MCRVLRTFIQERLVTRDGKKPTSKQTTITTYLAFPAFQVFCVGNVKGDSTRMDKTLLLPTKQKTRAQKPAAMDSCFGLVWHRQHGTASR